MQYKIDLATKQMQLIMLLCGRFPTEVAVIEVITRQDTRFSWYNDLLESE